MLGPILIDPLPNRQIPVLAPLADDLPEVRNEIGNPLFWADEIIDGRHFLPLSVGWKRKRLLRDTTISPEPSHEYPLENLFHHLLQKVRGWAFR